MRFVSAALIGAGVLWAGAACAQTAAPPPLEQDVWKAGSRCFMATTFVAGADDRITTAEIGDAMWFAVEAARQTPGEGGIMKQLSAIQGRIGDDGTIQPNAAAIVGQCNKRWPLSVRGGTKIVLPTAPFDRELLCMSVAAVLLGAAEEEKKQSGTSASADMLEKIVMRGQSALTDAEVAKHGISGEEQFTEEMGKALGRAVRLGNLNDVAEACR